MREILFRGKATNRNENREYRTNYKNGDWVYGLISKPYREQFSNLPSEMISTDGINGIEVDYTTIGQFTGLCDKNDRKIFEGDIVNLFNIQGKIVFEEGAFGIVIFPYIDWDLFDKKVSFNNHPYFCYNDNFVSLWELYWNFEQDDNSLYEVEVIGNIYDNSELLN